MATASPHGIEWPALPYAAWKDTRDTLHLWTQIVGKIRLTLTPWINHSWHVALYLTARGLTTSPIPYAGREFQIDFDFIDHVLWIRTSDGHFRQLMLAPMPVAQFYAELLAALGRQFPEGDPGADVPAFLERLVKKGLLRDAADPQAAGPPG